MGRSCHQEGNLQDLKPQWKIFFNMNVCLDSRFNVYSPFTASNPDLESDLKLGKTKPTKIFLSGMRRVSYMIPSTSCMLNYLVQTEAQWSQSTPPAPLRTVHATRVPGRRWVFFPPPLTSEVFMHSLISPILCVCLQVSHVFCKYGPGVRYVHFLHRLKNMFLNGFYKTMFVNSTVVVRPSKACS